MELTPEAVTQATSIGEVDRLLLGTDPVLVSPADSLHRLAEMAVERPGCRVLSVVDDSGVLVGLVPGANVVTLVANDPLTGRNSAAVRRTITVVMPTSPTPSLVPSAGATDGSGP